MTYCPGVCSSLVEPSSVTTAPGTFISAPEPTQDWRTINAGGDPSFSVYTRLGNQGGTTDGRGIVPTLKGITVRQEKYYQNRVTKFKSMTKIASKC